MPISDETRTAPSEDMKTKYRNLKRKLKILLYENECFQDELKQSQRHFLQVTRDKNFLLERLLQYETVDSTSSDSDATDSSDSGKERPPNTKATEQPKPARKRPADQGESSTSSKKKKPAANSVSGKGKQQASTVQASSSIQPIPAKPLANKTIQITTISGTTAPQFAGNSQGFVPIKIKEESQSSLPAPSKEGQLTSEELERHFESRPLQASMLIPEPLISVPVELFSNESSAGPLPD